MESIKSPTRKLPEYHFCVRVTPKTISKRIFEERGIEKQYKLQIEKSTSCLIQKTKNNHMKSWSAIFISKHYKDFIGVKAAISR